MANSLPELLNSQSHRFSLRQARLRLARHDQCKFIDEWAGSRLDARHGETQNEDVWGST